MKKIKLFLVAMASLLAVLAYGQNINVAGKISDSTTGEGVPFASVQLKGTMTGTVADADGNYSISVPATSTLVFSSVGYNNTEVAVNGARVLNAVLEPNAESLEETIVVAYGVQKKSSFTGSATQLSGEKLTKTQTSNVGKSLEGAVAGLMVTSSTGTPGSGVSIQIRGTGSLNASTAPLIVVDGVPYEGSLNSIPTQDIESITVLKDAAANSMYGARGSNGVIILTTKRGAAGKVNINFDAKVGVNSRGVPEYDVVTDPGEYYEMAWESIRNAVYYTNVMGLAQANEYASASLLDVLGPYNIYKGVSNTAIVDPTTGKLNPAAKERKWTDDWTRDVFRPGLRQEYNVAASGGSDKTQGYMSVSYLNDEGYVPNSGFTRVTVRAKVDHTIGKFIKAGLNLAYANTDQRRYNDSESTNYSNLFMFVRSIAPIYPIYLYDENGVRQYNDKGQSLYDWGETGRAYAPTSNPYGQMMSSVVTKTRDNISTRGYINVNILPELVFSVNAAYDVFNTRDNVYQTPIGGDAANVGGRGEQQMSRYMAMNANQLLTWTPTFGDHSITALLGHETKSDESYYLYGHMTSFVNKDVPDFANAVVYQDLNSATEEYFLEGFFSRVEYNYANRYLLSASYRIDGSSRFAPNKRWGDFWAVGASWNVKNEPFMQGVNWVDALRLKASFGTQGNDSALLSDNNLPRVYENLYRIDRVDGAASLTQVFRAAPDLTWEKSDNFNVGLEGKLWNRLNFGVEYYIKNTKDMIYYRQLPPSQGAPNTQYVNDMNMVNKGIEFDLSVDIFKNRDFSWNVALNGTHYTNKLTKIPSDWPATGKEYGRFLRRDNAPLREFYLYEYAGVDPKTGHALYNKYNDDGTVEKVTSTSEATKRLTGKTPVPDLYGGFSTALRYRGFDFSANFAYQLGGYVYDSTYQSLMTPGRAGDTWSRDIFNRWTPNNTNTDVPRVQLNDQTGNESSDRWLTSASYLSVRNVTLGYTLPKNLTSKIGIEGVRIYVIADNLWYTSARRGMDVRTAFDGSVRNTYSALRTVSGGITLTF